MDTVKRILDWLSGAAMKSSNEPAADEIIFEIATLEDAARIAMG